MDMPTPDTPPEAYLPRSAYTTARVAADPKINGLEQPLDAKHQELKLALRERDDLLELLQKKSALFDVADTHCDDDITGFELHLLVAIRKNRDNPKYRRYFATGVRDVTTAEPRQEEPEVVSDMLTAMAEDKNDPEIGSVITQWQPKLSASRGNVVAADADLTATEKALAYLEEKKIPALLASWREEYKKLEGSLTTAYPNDPKRVARCFKPFRKKRKPAKDATSNT